MSITVPPLHLLVVAGGRGLRAAGGGEVPKQFRPTGRGMLLRVAIDTFVGGDGADGRASVRPVSVTVTAPAAWHRQVQTELEELGVPVALADAGDSRTASTWRGLLALEAAFAPGDGDLVAIHDAARPFATAALLGRLAEAAAQRGGAVPGVPVPDTVVRSGQGRAHYLARETLLAVQTPQVFRWDQLREAHAWAAAACRSFTDDGGLLAARGHDPAVVEGETGNWKITTESDWRRAADLLAE
jgi:2-C-methyl-D-erythritol 4-phosphate cytidylyltransferase / 2-C-methyl-D-erythritol 2,4-cyclodiphosphate synthase